MVQRIDKIALLFFLLHLFSTLQAQERPFILVSNDEKEQILTKIRKNTWANDLYGSFRARIDDEITLYSNHPREFLRRLDLSWGSYEDAAPPSKLIRRGKRSGRNDIDILSHYLQLGIDCGVMYYLTGESVYACCATDILYLFVCNVSQLPYPEDAGNRGWVMPDDHLFEARAIGAQLPVLYDFIATYIMQGGEAFDVAQQKKVQFPVHTAQKVFRGYAQLAIDQGMTGSNWSVLEAPSLVFNALALENKTERDALLDIYLYHGSRRQDPLTEIASYFQKQGDVYPETFQYSNGVANITTILMAVIDRYNDTLNLGSRYKYIPLALSRWDAMKYPNGEIVRFGDGKRHGGTSYTTCEYAYYLGKLAEEKEIIETMGNLILTAIDQKQYSRESLPRRDFGAHIYFDPLKLLWGSPEIEGKVIDRKMSRTDEMPHAGLFLQRNFSSTGKPENDMMCFVAGSHMVHGHAEGMNIELYGKGQVLGVDHGRGSYRRDIHENYSRLYAAHNTVIVNGNSCSEGGWVNLGINSVQLNKMEPMPRTAPLSTDHSFSITGFVDEKGEKAEAIQERTLALIRTSPVTGYYVDIFRSKSSLPHQFHDYLYHNIGDRITFLNKELTFHSTPERYTANANIEWIQNRQYRHPGWHFFQDVKTSDEYSRNVEVQFVAKKFNEPLFMNLYIPGFEDREYSKVKAPKTYEAPGPYEEAPTPTLVIRNKGEAWNHPFVVVYEPFDKHPENHSIQKVEKLMMNDLYCGLKITSKIDDKNIIQYIITPSENQTLNDIPLSLSFKGRFAIITTTEHDVPLNIYIGAGQELTFQNFSFTSEVPNTKAYIDLTLNNPKLSSHTPDIIRWSVDR